MCRGVPIRFIPSTQLCGSARYAAPTFPPSAVLPVGTVPAAGAGLLSAELRSPYDTQSSGPHDFFSPTNIFSSYPQKAFFSFPSFSPTLFWLPAAYHHDVLHIVLLTADHRPYFPSIFFSIHHAPSQGSLLPDNTIKVAVPLMTYSFNFLAPPTVPPEPPAFFLFRHFFFLLDVGPHFSPAAASPDPLQCFSSSLFF